MAGIARRSQLRPIQCSKPAAPAITAVITFSTCCRFERAAADSHHQFMSTLSPRFTEQPTAEPHACAGSRAKHYQCRSATASCKQWSMKIKPVSTLEGAIVAGDTRAISRPISSKSGAPVGRSVAAEQPPEAVQPPLISRASYPAGEVGRLAHVGAEPPLSRPRRAYFCS